MRHPLQQKDSGFALIESILSVGLIVAFISIFTMVSIYAESQTFFLLKRSHALFLAEEGLEASRGMRDTDFSSLADGTHGLMLEENAWTFSGSMETTEEYRRSITVESLTPETKKITASVSWDERIGEESLSLSTILTDWK